MQLVKLHTTVQKPVDVVQNWSVQMYYTPTSSGRCGEAGPEKAVVATRSCCCCCNVTAWYQCRLSELPSHPRRAPLYPPSRSLLRLALVNGFFAGKENAYVAAHLLVCLDSFEVPVISAFLINGRGCRGTKRKNRMLRVWRDYYVIDIYTAVIGCRGCCRAVRFYVAGLRV